MIETMPPTKSRKILYLARQLTRARLSVIPIRPDGTKAAAVEWKLYQNQIADDETLQAWFQNDIKAGLALIGGMVSGGLENADFDAAELFEPWKKLVREYEGGDDLLRRLVIIATPRPGYAVLYRCPEVSGNLKLAQRDETNADGKLARKTLIETRGEGGYFLIPGGPLECHQLRKPYVMIQGDLTAIPVITPEEREILHSCARVFGELPPPPPKKTVREPKLSDGTRPGDEFAARVTWPDILAPAGWTLLYARGETDYWRRPGKKVGWSATTNYNGSDVLHVFSTNAAPFEAETNYNKFAAYALLNHDGDFSAAARALVAAGFGSPAPEVEESDEELFERKERAASKPKENAEPALEDFYALMTEHKYIFAPTRDLWPAESVNSRITAIDPATGKRISAAKWLDQYRPVEQMTWCPGQPMIIRNRLIAGAGGWIERRGCSCFNRYRPPQILPGDPEQATPWVDLVRRIYRAEADHIIKWVAHRVQKPEEKINHALVLGGLQGIGKDTLLEPVRYAVGPWNFAEVSPVHVLGNFNSFSESVILRISEAHDLGDSNRFAFYDRMKLYTAAPPLILRCNEKNIREYYVPNLCGVVITTNHKTDGIYLPADDRRHYVAWSGSAKEDFEPDYWRRTWGYYDSGGYGHVAAYLRGLNISGFDPKAPPPKTEAFWEIVNTNRAPENAELADAIDALGNPDALTISDVVPHAGSLSQWLLDRKNSRSIPFRFEDVGYVAVRNPDARSDGLWKIDGKRQVVYARRELSLGDRISAARGRTERTW